MHFITLYEEVHNLSFRPSIDPKVIEPWLGPNVLKHRMINIAVGEQTIEGALENYEKH